MSVDVQHEVEIGRAADDVFQFVAEFENNPRWQKGMRSCEWTSDHRGVGATYVQRARFLGRNIDTHFEVTELEPGHRISIASTVSTFPIQVTRSVESISANRCRVRAHVRGQPTGWMKLMSGMVRRSVVADYERLVALLEREA